jgi:predicted lipoprotein
MLLYDPEFAGYGPGDPTCTLVATVAGDLARQAEALDAGWQDFAALMKSAGEPGNTTFAEPAEAQRALYTQILSSLEFTAGSRIGAPMGTFEKPRPARAEARRSGRSLANVRLAVTGAVTLAEALVGQELPATRAALESFDIAADKIEDPAFADVEDPSARFRLEVLQQQVQAVDAAIEAEVGSTLGLSAGFNSQDGD